MVQHRSVNGTGCYEMKSSSFGGKLGPAPLLLLSIKKKSTLKSAWFRGYKTFFMLNSVELEISNPHKY